MKTIFLLSLILLQFETSELVGKWSFSKYESSKKLDDTSKAFASNAFSKFYFEFRNDATYNLTKRHKNERGTWKKVGEFIVITNSDGHTDKIKYIQKHRDTLRLEIASDEFIILQRVQ